MLNQKNALQAAMTCDRQLALTTFMNDPLMGGVNWPDGERLFDRMIRAQLGWLPPEWRRQYA